MSKYAPFRDYLMLQRHQEFDMTFREHEEIIGAYLNGLSGEPKKMRTKNKQTFAKFLKAWRARMGLSRTGRSLIRTLCNKARRDQTWQHKKNGPNTNSRKSSITNDYTNGGRF